jgi:hypothetical protein
MGAKLLLGLTGPKIDQKAFVTWLYYIAFGQEIHRLERYVIQSRNPAWVVAPIINFYDLSTQIFADIGSVSIAS